MATSPVQLDQSSFQPLQGGGGAAPAAAPSNSGLDLTTFQPVKPVAASGQAPTGMTAAAPQTSIIPGKAAADARSMSPIGADEAIPNFMQGAAQGVIETGGGISKLLGGPAAPEAVTKSEGMAQHFGKGFETLVEFLGGQGVLNGLGTAERLAEFSKLIAPLQKYPKLAAALIRGIESGTVAGGQTVAKGGSGKEALASGAAVGAGGALLEGAMGALRKAGTAFSESEAGKRLADAINPGTEKLGELRSQITQQVGALMNFAERNGINLTKGRAELGQAARGAAAERKEFYDIKLLEPLKDELLPNGKSAGAMDARLDHLNNLLASPYEAGTVGASEQRMAWAGEAGEIRKQLYEFIGKRMDLDPQKVAELRNSIGELNSIGQHVENALDAERTNINTKKAEPYRGSVSPLSENFVPDQVMRGGVNAIKGTPGNQLRTKVIYDREVGHVFRHMAPVESGELPKPTLLSKEATPRSEASWKQPEAARAPGATIAEQQAAKESERAAQAKAQAERQANRKTMREQSQARAEKNRAQHGQWKQAASASEGLGGKVGNPTEENGYFEQAKKELGEKASVSEIALRAQKLKDEAAAAGAGK